MSTAVATIGYEIVGQPAFIARLRAEAITLLVDVRAIANSRRAGFAKRLLSSSLADAGIGYRHCVALGTPKAGREAAKKGDIANSRRAGFAKRLLSSSLADAGIGYRHCIALGTPKAGRDAAKKGDIATLRAIYADTLEEPAAQLDLREIAKAAETGTVCMMCFEEDWRLCHRAMICERLAADLNVQARHLTFS